MAAGITSSASARNPLVFRIPLIGRVNPIGRPAQNLQRPRWWAHPKRAPLAICFVLEKQELGSVELAPASDEAEVAGDLDSVAVASGEIWAEKLGRKKSERVTYLVAAVMSSFGINSMAVLAVYYRFYWQTDGGEVPLTEMLGTFALSVGAAVGMEFWARWAHRALWHASLWHMHQSHHKAREGAFELNDVFAVVNSVPAIALLSYGFFHKGLFPGLCFGAGLGITVFGMAYMFVHDGLVHKRFPVGPIANVPYFRKVAAAHQELDEVGCLEQLEKEINRRIKLYDSS